MRSAWRGSRIIVRVRIHRGNRIDQQTERLLLVSRSIINRKHHLPGMQQRIGRGPDPWT